MKKKLTLALTIISIILLSFTSYRLGEKNGEDKAERKQLSIETTSIEEIEESKEIPATDAVIFLGDSITEQYNLKKDFHSDLIINKGLSGNKIEDVIVRIPSISGYHPRAVYLLIGINNLTDNQNLDLFETLYRDLIDKLKNTMPDTEIIIQSILPINTNLYKKSPLTIDTILQANKIIQQIASDYEIEYFNIQYFFKDRDGMLDKDLTKDGLHLSEKGYQIWLNQLKKREDLEDFFEPLE